MSGRERWVAQLGVKISVFYSPLNAATDKYETKPVTYIRQFPVTYLVEASGSVWQGLALGLLPNARVRDQITRDNTET